MHWIHLSQDRDQWRHGNEPSGSIKYSEIPEYHLIPLLSAVFLFGSIYCHVY
jgi:hypothetical protein